MEYKNKMAGMLAAGAVLGAMAFSLVSGGTRQEGLYHGQGAGSDQPGQMITVMSTGRGVAILRQSQGIQQGQMAEDPVRLLLESASVMDGLDEGQQAAVEALQVQIMDLRSLTAQLLNECGYGMTTEQQAALALYQSQMADVTQQLRDLLESYGSEVGGALSNADEAQPSNGLRFPQEGPAGEIV